MCLEIPTLLPHHFKISKSPEQNKVQRKFLKFVSRFRKKNVLNFLCPLNSFRISMNLNELFDLSKMCFNPKCCSGRYTCIFAGLNRRTVNFYLCVVRRCVRTLKKYCWWWCDLVDDVNWVKMEKLVILLVLLPLCSGLLDVQCRYENLQPTGRVICECSSFPTSASTGGYEDLAETIYNFVNNRFRQNLPFSSVALNNCRSLKITVDFG